MPLIPAHMLWKHVESRYFRRVSSRNLSAAMMKLRGGGRSSFCARSDVPHHVRHLEEVLAAVVQLVDARVAKLGSLLPDACDRAFAEKLEFLESEMRLYFSTRRPNPEFVLQRLVSVMTPRLT